MWEVDGGCIDQKQFRFVGGGAKDQGRVSGTYRPYRCMLCPDIVFAYPFRTSRHSHHWEASV